MILTVLDRSCDDKWFLVKAKLWDYLEALTDDNFNFEIQRSIVNNSFLDNLYETVKIRQPFPPITLHSSNKGLNGVELQLSQFEILDGLQRTYRLWLYKRIVELYETNNEDWKLILEKVNNLPNYKRGFFTVKRIREIVNNKDEIVDHFKNYDIYFYVWIDLTKAQLIKQMLTLNVGSKRVSRTHQYELIFLSVYSLGKDLSKLELIRSKDADYEKIRRGDRNPGQLTFSSAMIGLQSLLAGKALRIDTTDFDLENFDDDNSMSASWVETMFSSDNLKIYLNAILGVDNALCIGKNKNDYLKWFVKDTTISGMMGAVGAKMNAEGGSHGQWLEKLQGQLSCLKDDPYQLLKFDEQYQQLPSTRINIGKVVRNAVYYFTLMLLEGKDGEWRKAFNMALNRWELV